jgi:DNA-binding IclR family transcriptional regulator
MSDLARQLELPKASVANLLAALEEADLIHRTDGRYRLGHATLELGSAYLRAVPFLKDFGDACQRLPSASAETVLLGQLDGSDVLYLARHDGSQPIRLASDIGRRLPANCTSLGKSMLASMAPAAVLKRYRGLPAFPRLSPNSLRSVDELMQDLELTRQRGYAIDDEENTVGIMCLGVAIPRLDPNEPVRAVSVTLLKARADEDLQAGLVKDLTELASRLALRSRD